jgi:hypothetical protein
MDYSPQHNPRPKFKRPMITWHTINWAKLIRG